MSSLSIFDPLIASRSLLRHPFYVRWTKGQLTLDELRVYAKEYYHLVRAVPEIVAAVAAKAPPEAAAMIERNRMEETEHMTLWERFAASLGVGKEALLAHVPSATVREAVASLRRLAEDGSYEDGVAAVYALERELPEIARTKKEGLLQYYGLSSADAHAYFDEHLREEAHLQVWRAVPMSDQQRQAVTRSMDAQNRVLDGVCETAGIALEC